MACRKYDDASQKDKLLAISPPGVVTAASAAGTATVRAQALLTTASPKVDDFDRRWKLNLRETAKLEDFEIHRTVGVGAFGRVLYVTNKINKRDYAMKAIKKERVVRMEQVTRVLAEKRILQSVVHPFLVNLRFVFKTTSYLYLVMPFVQGGEIYSYMRAFETLSENQARFLSGQLILALQYLHKMNIVYRDIKPENILMECDGYLKITDFGFSKRIDPAVGTTSFVGTPEYMAPEMLVRVRRLAGYAFSVDWWSLGVFIYECAAGMPPFSGNSLLQVFDHIVKGEFDVPEHFSDTMADLVQKLFHPNEHMRIGCKHRGADEIKAHNWYAAINWHALLEKKLPSEFVPQCRIDDRASNYDVYKEEPMEQAVKDEYSNVFRNF